MENLGKLVVAVVFTIVTLAAVAPGAQLMWGWFITPLYPTLTVPLFGQTMGLLMVFALITFLARPMKLDSDVEMGETIVKGILKVLTLWMYVGIAFIVKVLFI